jgi:hypothetical protein
MPQPTHPNEDLESMVRMKWMLPNDKIMTGPEIGFRHKMLLCQKMAHNMI